MSILETTSPPYVERTTAGGLRVAGTRVSLDSVVHEWRGGRNPQEIVAAFPTLTLELVHGALAFYLRNREAIDQYLEEQRIRSDQLRKESDERNRELRVRILRRADESKPGGSA